MTHLYGHARNADARPYHRPAVAAGSRLGIEIDREVLKKYKVA